MKKLTNWHRHISVFVKYGTFLKYLNLGKAYLFYAMGKNHINSMPAFLKIEISRKCTINCKYCDLVVQKDNVFFPLEDFQKIIEKFKPYIFEISLYDIGEPLENIKIIDYIKIAKANGIGTIISTTLSIQRNEKFWEDFALSGLDYLIVSIDGVTNKTYQKYRTNGNLELVLSNLNKIIQYRNQHHSKLIIEWQMLDLPWNKHEQKEAQKISKKIGCQRFRLIEEMVLKRIEAKQSNKIRKHNCLLPYILLIINAYKQVRPCYKIYHENMILGNFESESFDEIWNGKEIKTIRDKNKIGNKLGCMTCHE